MSSSSKSPLVSIMIPTFNQAQFVGDAIESIISQTYDNLEIIVLDDHSQDSTEKVVKGYDDERIRYIKNEENLGRVNNYRNGLYNHAKGEWVLVED